MNDSATSYAISAITKNVAAQIYRVYHKKCSLRQTEKKLALLMKPCLAMIYYKHAMTYKHRHEGAYLFIRLSKKALRDQ